MNDPTGMSAEDGIETHFVNEKGETIANTDDNNDEIYVIRKQNEDSFAKEMEENVKSKDDLNPEINKNLGDNYGYNIDNHSTEIDGAVYEVDNMSNRSLLERIGYDHGFEDKTKFNMLNDLLRGAASKGIGYSRGATHRVAGKMHAFEPKTLNTPARNYIRTNQATRVNSYKYSPKPIPLLID